jgi:hypothetical protein
MIARLLGLLGVKTAIWGLILGMSLGAASGGFLGFKAGEWLGYRAGYAAADREAELNTIKAELAAREADLAAWKKAAAQARDNAVRNAAAAETAKEWMDSYAKELEELRAVAARDAALPPPDRPEREAGAAPVPQPPPRPSGSCRAATDLDVRRLRENHFRPRQPGSASPNAARGR